MVVTIFCCGTSSTSFDFANENYFAGETVSTLAYNHEGMEFVEWAIFDGPGSGNLQTEELWAKTFKSPPAKWKGVAFGTGWENNVEAAIALLEGKPSYSRTSHSKSEAKKLLEFLMASHRLRMENRLEVLAKEERGFFGRKKKSKEVKDIFHRAKKQKESDLSSRPRISPQELQAKKVDIFRKKKRDQELELQPLSEELKKQLSKRQITGVNLIGWSRGGVTTHMLANKMFQTPSLKHIPVRIVAIDPVPGKWNFQPHRTKLEANVHQYVGIYAQHEISAGFNPTIPETAPKTTRVIIPIFGRHATVVGNASVDGDQRDNKKLKEVGTIVRDLAEKYLASWGTELGNTLDLSDKQVIELYKKVLEDKALYVKMSETTYTIKDGPPRKVAVGTQDDFVDFDSVPELQAVEGYVNLHHAALVARSSPLQGKALKEKTKGFVLPK
mgnify:CR=1 FL=1